MPPQRSLVAVFPLLPLLSTSSRSWPMPCASTRPSHNFTSTTMTTRLVMRESRPRGRSGRSLEDHRENRDPRATICSRDEFGTLSRYESRIYPPFSSPKIDHGLGISFSLCRFLRQQSWALTGSCCRPWSQQDHQRCWVVRWPAHRWRNAGLVAGDQKNEIQLGGPCWCPVH